MPRLEWSEALSLDLPLMDDTHKEFVDLLAAVDAAPTDGLVAAWDALVAHTQAHFDREDAWMRQTRFASSNCHSMQHRVVLNVMGEVQKRCASGPDEPLLREMVIELGKWFPQHAQSMDAALALHLRRVGYDPQTGIVSAPQALPQTLIEGCGGASCSDARATAEAA